MAEFQLDLESVRGGLMDCFDLILKDVDNEMMSVNSPSELREHLIEMFKYTLTGGKMTRGCLVVYARSIILGRELKEEEAKGARILGWCVEMLQGMFLILDDIMDCSTTRRGKPCWYKVEGVGLTSINDSVICNAFIYQTITNYFRDEPFYTHLLQLFFKVILQTGYGQGVDMMTAPTDRPNLSEFTEERYDYIVEYKTAYYTFYLPIAAAMYISGIYDEEIHAKVKKILVEIGKYYQVQDDYIDFFGDPQKTGKIGTDIQDNKCSWLIVNALKICAPEQRKILYESYGRSDTESINKVVDIYKSLNLRDLYSKFEDEKIRCINELISDFPENYIPKKVFYTIMNIISKRTT